MIHRALLGSFERFFGVLIEHYAGNFPLWLAPEQVRIIPVSEKTNEYALKVNKKLKEKDIRASVDTENEKLGYKIRKAELEKIPYIIVVGKKEEEQNKISVRKHGGKDLGTIDIEEFIKNLINESKNF
jgi:threonyl-tRNA synthetase